MFGLFVRRHSILLFKVCSNYTLLHHLRTTKQKFQHCKSPSSINTSQVWDKRPKSRKREHHLRCYWIYLSSHNYELHYSFYNTASKGEGEQKKSITYLPHLGSSFPLVSAANWRQVLICCHQNWCINPRAPSLWCRGQYGWTSLSWNKLAMRKVLWKGSHVSYFTSAHS